jgi:hypothetical protein
MKININGVVRDMTAEEEATYKTISDEQGIITEPTAEERIAALEDALLELLGVETDD